MYLVILLLVRVYDVTAYCNACEVRVTEHSWSPAVDILFCMHGPNRSADVFC